MNVVARPRLETDRRFHVLVKTLTWDNYLLVLTLTRYPTLPWTYYVITGQALLLLVATSSIKNVFLYFFFRFFTCQIRLQYCNFLTLPKPPWPRNLTLKKSSIPFAHQILSVCRRLTGGSAFLSPESFLFLPVCKIQSSWCYVSFMLVTLRIWYLNKVRKSKEVLDSGFHVLDSGFQIPALQKKLKGKFPDSRFFLNSSKSIWERGHLSIGRRSLLSKENSFNRIHSLRMYVLPPFVGSLSFAMQNLSTYAGWDLPHSVKKTYFLSFLSFFF